MNSLLAASAVDGSVFLKSGRKRNLEEAEEKMGEAENLLLLQLNNN